MKTAVRRQDANYQNSIASDDHYLLAAYAGLLQREGYEVRTASSEDDCLRLAAEYRPELISATAHCPALTAAHLRKPLAAAEFVGRVRALLGARRGLETEGELRPAEALPAACALLLHLFNQKRAAV